MIQMAKKERTLAVRRRREVNRVAFLFLVPVFIFTTIFITIWIHNTTSLLIMIIIIT